ncbi:Uma2 family endonuclease [Rhodopirellula sp. JC639]|uniref:Uma2 family endonuclease n=1 Tax=Stieleria mannarensis TaxID=2755585 RepID=UPI001600AB00|nr:Uma2 family endonuclease [Rhodopirellula sp. JC639]
MTVPITTAQYETLVSSGTFENTSGQTELIHGRIVHMNPQGPEHADPIDHLNEWSFEQVGRRFTIRIEKLILLVGQHSCPEPDIVWATRRRYSQRHPHPDEVHLLIEVSKSSVRFDRTEKMQLYAEAGIPEYWQIDIAEKTVTVHRDPHQQRYRSIQTYEQSDIIGPLCLPDAQLAIASLFTPDR